MTTASVRPPLLKQGLLDGVVGAALLGLALLGDVPLLAGVVLLQVLAVLGFLALVEAPASAGVFAIAAAATAAADTVAMLDDGRVRGLAAVVGVALVVSLLHQLSRSERSRVTESLADTFVAVVLVCCSACLLAVQVGSDGDGPLRAGLVAAAATLVVGRVADLVVRRPVLAPGAARGFPGLVLGLVAGAVAGLLVAGDDLTGSQAAYVGLAAAATVAAVDLLVDLSAAELTPDTRDARRLEALRPVLTFLPYVLLGPVLLAAVLLLERG